MCREYRGSKARDAGRPFQGCVAVDPRGRPNPASSRNLKPPALAGGGSHKVRKAEYARVTGPKRKFIKGQKYVLLTRKENLTREGRRNLKLLLAANKRLNTAYLLRESFAQLWDYKSQAWARRFFDNWKSQLRWQRLKPFEAFAQMIERHWDGVAAYCRPENKIALGFVEGLNNKIRVFQRRAYGLRDEDYLRLKILTCSLPEL